MAEAKIFCGHSFPDFISVVVVDGIRSYELAACNITVSSCGFSERASNSPIIFYCVLFGIIASFVRPAKQIDSKLRSSFERSSLYGRE